MSFPRYPAYKSSGVEWLGSVPEHWRVDRLKRYLSLLTEKSDSKKNPVALENIEGWSGRFIASETEFEGDGVQFETEDILFGKLRPYLAKVLLAPWPGEAVGDFHVLRTKPGVFPRFAQYLMLTRSFIDIVDGSTFGSKMPRAGWEFVGDMPLPIPSFDEQKSIAGFLNRETAKIDALVAEQEQLINLLKEKRQAVISHAVTKGLDPSVPMKDSGVEWLGEVPEHWEVKRIKDCGCEVVDCKNRTPEPHVDGEYFVVRTSCVKDAEFNPEPGYWTDEENFIEWTAKGRPQLGDVLFTREAPTGEACLAPEGLEFCLGQRMMYIRPPKQVLLSEFLLYSIYGGLARERINEKSKGSTVGHLRVGEVGELPLLLPPLDEQQALVKFVGEELSQLRALAAQAEQAIALMTERRSALISAAVTGQIDVRGLAPAQEQAA